MAATFGPPKLSSSVYLPSTGSMGMSMDQPPVRGALRPLGKTIHIQHLGTVSGMRGAGLNNLPGENHPISHTFNNYGKGGISGLDGGGGGQTGNGGGWGGGF